MSGEMIPVERLLCSQIVFRHGTRTPLHLLPLGRHDVISCESRSNKYGLKNVFYGSDLFHPHPPSEVVKITLDKSKGPSTKSRRDYLISIGVDPDVKLKGGADYGMLTTQGRKQLYDLGQKIADMLSAYPGFMQALPLRTNLWVQSSFDFRTLESVQSFLSGIYSKTTRINGFTEQAIEVPVHVESFEEDYMFPNCLATPILNRNVPKLYSFLDDDNPIKIIRTEFLKEYDVENYAYGLIELDDELTCRKWLNLPMSPEIAEWHEKFVENVPREYNYIYGYKLSHEDFIKISVGRLLNLIVSNMKSHASSNDDGPPFLYVFSAHDTTLHSLNVALGRKDTEWPPFASYMLFQLFSGNKGLYMKVTYNDQAISFDDEMEPAFDKMLNFLNPLLCTNEEMLSMNARLASESQ